MHFNMVLFSNLAPNLVSSFVPRRNYNFKKALEYTTDLFWYLLTKVYY